MYKEKISSCYLEECQQNMMFLLYQVHSVLKNLDKEKYDIFPIYIDKEWNLV